MPFDSLDSFLKEQSDCFLFLDRLIESGTPVLVLNYEEFTKNLDSLLDQLQKSFNFSIDPQDITVLKNALCKENVIANTRKFNNFLEFDQFSSFLGAHIDTGELTKEFSDSVRDQLHLKSVNYSYIFKKWGYLNSDDPIEKI